MDPFFLWKKLKKYLVVGLIAILPLWITYYVLLAVFGIAASLAKPFLRAIPALSETPALLNTLSFLATVLIVLALGLLLTNVVGRQMFQRFEARIARVPLLSWIYTSIRKLTALFYQDEGLMRLQRVVMFEYPRRGIYVIGFLTSESVALFNRATREELVNIFLPTTPNPTSGFLLMIPKRDVMPMDISVEDAVKLIVSGGIAAPGGGA